jgi:predicted DNA-binding transcriptional regulator AlpA
VRDKLVKASEVRALFDLRSNARVYEIARRGVLPGAVRLGRQVRFDLEKIADFIDRGG